MFKAFLAAVIGSVLAFMWSFVSWSVLPFHEEAMSKFKDEGAVNAFLESQVDEPGIYLLPSDKGLEDQVWNEKLAEGPFMFASIRVAADEDSSMTKNIVRGFTATLVCGIILAILLGAVAPRLNYLGRVFYVILIAVFVGIAGIYPNSIWWEFSSGHILWSMADLVIGWGIAALVMAALINGKRAASAD